MNELIKVCEEIVEKLDRTEQMMDAQTEEKRK